MNTTYLPSVENCRLCGSKDLFNVLSFNPTPLCESYTSFPSEDSCFPLEISLCKNCCLLQLRSRIPHEWIFSNYYKEQPIIVRNHDYCIKYVSSVLERWSGRGTPTVLQIGSNDGGLLRYFQDEGSKVIGCESHIKLATSADENGIRTVHGSVGPQMGRQILQKHGQVDIIIIDNSFGGQHPDHLANSDNIRQYLSFVTTILKYDGMVVIQTNDLLKMISDRLFDLFYHEHCVYFSKQTICRLFSQEQLFLYDTDILGQEVAATRYFFKHDKYASTKVEQSSNQTSEFEAPDLCNVAVYSSFYEEVERQVTAIKHKLANYSASKIVGYGASASCTTAIYEFGLSSYLAYLVDDNLQRVGKYSPGCNLLVRDVSVLYEEHIDLILILAWRHAKKITNNHPELMTKMMVVNMIAN